MIFLMRLFSYNNRLDQLENGLLYNSLDNFYKINKNNIISG
jgi:hypothetical protein